MRQNILDHGMLFTRLLPTYSQSLNSNLKDIPTVVIQDFFFSCSVCRKALVGKNILKQKKAFYYSKKTLIPWQYNSAGSIVCVVYMYVYDMSHFYSRAIRSGRMWRYRPDDAQVNRM